MVIHNALGKYPANVHGDYDYSSCYYHHAFTATLVLLDSLLNSTEEEEKTGLTEMCLTSMEIFRGMSPLCADRGVALLQSALSSLTER